MEELKSLAQRALDGDDVLEAVELFEFSGDEDAHDDAFQEKLERQFEAKFDDACDVLAGELGEPSRTGSADDDAIPLCGVFRFALWEKAGRGVYLAAAHEDRECPFLILIGNV